MSASACSRSALQCLDRFYGGNGERCSANPRGMSLVATRMYELQAEQRRAAQRRETQWHSSRECNSLSKNEHRTRPSPDVCNEGRLRCHAREGWLLGREERRTLQHGYVDNGAWLLGREERRTLKPDWVAREAWLLGREERRTLQPGYVAKGAWLLGREEHRALQPVWVAREGCLLGREEHRTRPLLYQTKRAARRL
jgi:hypothetical protein